jgi:hypothetical protein
MQRSSGTTHNSEYPAPLRSAQIGSRWSPTSGTRSTFYEMVAKDGASLRRFGGYVVGALSWLWCIDNYRLFYIFGS